MQVNIHPTAIISDGAIIGEGTTVGAYSMVGPKVVLGKNNKIGPHVVLEGNTKFGDENEIFQFASIGAKPQDLKYQGEDSVLEIGNKNIIREFVTLQPGTKGGGMITKIGDQNLFMANCHVGHDAIIGSRNIFANSAAIAGHVIIGNNVTLGGLSGVHQFVHLGDFCLLGAGSMITKDVPPYCIAQGDRAHLFGINKVALERKGYSSEEIVKLRTIYRGIFLDKGNFSEKIAAAESDCAGFELGAQLVEFIKKSERGVTMPKRAEADI